MLFVTLDFVKTYILWYNNPVWLSYRGGVERNISEGIRIIGKAQISTSVNPFLYVWVNVQINIGPVFQEWGNPAQEYSVNDSVINLFVSIDTLVDIGFFISTQFTIESKWCQL